MSSKVAEGMATTGPDDTLVAVDGTGETPDSVISKIVTTSSSAGSNVGAAAKATALDPSALAGAIKFTDGKLGLDSKSLKDSITEKTVSGSDAQRRLNNANGTNLANIPGLKGDDLALAESYLPGIVADDKLELANELGEIYSIGKDVDTDSAAGLMKGIDSLTGVAGVSEYIDNNAQLALALSYLDKASALGIPAAIDKLMKKYKDEKRARQRLIARLRSVVVSGDIDTTLTIIGYIGYDGALEKVPDLITLMLSNYRFARNTKVSEYPAKRAQLLTLFNNLDSNWDTVTRNGAAIADLGPWSRVSKDASTVLWIEPGYEVQLMMGGTYRSMSTRAAIQRQYPLMAEWI